MVKTSLACAVMLALGAACSGANKSCPSDEMRPDQRAGARSGAEGTAETVIPGDPQERTIILIPVPEGEMNQDGETPEDAVPAPGGPDSGEDPQAPTIFLIPIEPDGAQPDMPQDGGGLQEDVVPDFEGDATSETQVPRDEPAEEPAPPAPDPKDIYF